MSGAAGVQTAWPMHVSVRSEHSVYIQQSDSEGDSAEKATSIVLTFLHVKSGIVELWNFLLLPTYHPKLSEKTSHSKKLEGMKL